MNPILFFDADCSFCRAMVYLLSKLLVDQPIKFAPLKGITAHKHLKIIKPDSIIFLEPNLNKTTLRAEAFFRAISYRIHFFIHLAKIAFLFNPLYRLIAILRRFFPKFEFVLKGPSFLP